MKIILIVTSFNYYTQCPKLLKLETGSNGKGKRLHQTSLHQMKCRQSSLPVN